MVIGTATAGAAKAGIEKGGGFISGFLGRWYSLIVIGSLIFLVGLAILFIPVLSIVCFFLGPGILMMMGSVIMGLGLFMPNAPIPMGYIGRSIITFTLLIIGFVAYIILG